MKKIFCKFLSVAITLIISFQFFACKYTRAVTLNEIVSDQTAVTANCFGILNYLNRFPGLNNSPEHFEDNDQLWSKDRVLKTLNLILLKIISIQRNKRNISRDGIIFSGFPRVSIRHYIERFLKYASAGNRVLIATIIMTLIFLDNLISESEGGIVIDSLNVHRLFAVSYLISFKFCEDVYYDNEHMSRVAGIPKEELDILELHFLFKIKFNLAYHDRFDAYYILFVSLLQKIHNLI